MYFVLFLESVREYVGETFSRLDSWTSFLLFCPLVLYEVLRYTLPVPIMLVMESFGWWRDHTAEKCAFMKRSPFVSIVIAGRNESENIEATLESLLSLPYQNKEIIVVDDNSTDNMHEICRKYEERNAIRLLRNNEAAGRVGRPVASNIGLRHARGEFIISLDADTSYDRNMIQEMIGPFFDPKVGVVAGNLKVANLRENLWTICQGMEYAISIGIWKRWTGVRHVTLQASGAFGAFRREALNCVGGWDPELAEDADLSLKMRRAGWDIAFSPYAIAMTHTPSSLRALVRQRVRWDKGAVRTYFHKHRHMLNPLKSKNVKFSLELLQEFFMIYLLPLVYVFYTGVLLWFDWRIWLFAQVFCYFLYVLMTGFCMLAVLHYSERKQEEYFLLLYVPFFPVYKEIFRWVRIYANICETFRIGYKESYLPESSYSTTPW